MTKTFLKKGKGDGITPESSQVSGISYDEPTKQLMVTYHNGKTYAYNNVPLEVWIEAEKASSIGSFLASTVNNVYPYKSLN